MVEGQSVKRALQFGAGNIGRGFIGVLLSQSGYEVIFVDIVEQLIDLLNSSKRYPVVVVSPDGEQVMTVEGVGGINARHESEVVTGITEASLITTAVGAGALKAIAPAIAKGLQQRVDLKIGTPLNVIACENLIDNSKVLWQHVVENLVSADESRVGILSDKELAILSKARDKYRELCPIPCTECRYCMPCPSGVDIPRVLEKFNNGVMHDDPDGARQEYKWIPEEARAEKCTQCLECEEVCPQQIPVSEWMVHVEEVLAQGRPYEECLAE